VAGADDDDTPKNDLERVLVAAMSDPSARAAFYETLLASDVYFLIPPQQGERKGMTVVAFQGPNGRFTPLFAAKERIAMAIGPRADEFDVMGVSGRDAMKILADQNAMAVLNPGNAIGKPFSAEEIAALVSGEIGAAAHVVPKGRQVMLGQAKEPPQALIDALVAHSKAVPAIAGLHLAQLHDPQSGDPPHPIVGVNAEDARAVIGGLSEVAAKSWNEPVDFVGMGGASGLADYLKNVPPFYRR
jgi:hypothetical protein